MKGIQHPLSNWLSALGKQEDEIENQSLTCLDGVFVDIAQPTMLELWDEVVSIHPGILETLGEVGFGEVPRDGLRTASHRESMYIAYYVFRWRFHFGLKPGFQVQPFLIDHSFPVLRVSVFSGRDASAESLAIAARSLTGRKPSPPWS